MRFQRQRVHEVCVEVQPLLYAHWLEIARDQDIPLDPDWETYKALEDGNRLRVFTARTDEGRLLGYAAFIVTINPHYRSSLQATQDVIYIDKERRGFGRSFIEWCDNQLRNDGVQKVFHHVKAKHDFGPLLERLGYELADKLYARRLDK